MQTAGIAGLERGYQGMIDANSGAGVDES
jgi:hypothetical protein